MIKRRASEIIRLALNISQTQNTDALSWRDCIDMLNQSYIRLYSELNNSGDLYYSKEIDFKNGTSDKIKLPKDFWKLLEIGYRSAIKGGLIPIERAPNSGQYFSGYKIINNELIFDNHFMPGELVVRYIPQPQTITFPKAGLQIAGKAVQAAYDSFNDVIVLGNAGNITVINRSNGSVLNKDMSEIVTNPISGDLSVILSPYVLAVSREIIYIVKETGIDMYDFNLNMITAAYKGNFDLYAHSIGWEEGIIVKMNNVTKKFIAGNEPIDSKDYWNFMDGEVVKSDSSYVFQTENEVLVISEIFENADSYVIADPYIYINRNGSPKVYDNFEPTDLAPALVGRGTRKGIVIGAEINNETGYGVIFKDFFTGLNMVGYAADTVLNYPNNLFFDWLAADLAVKFRIALDIPTNELPALAADYWDTLMKGISRDAYKSQRIGNVYA